MLVGTSCVDKYEASVWRIPSGQTELIAKVKDGTATLAELQGGSFQQGATGDDYNCNDNGNDCNVDEYAASVAGVTPARFVTWFQAQQFCRMAGKRLVANAEWQAAAAGHPRRRALCGQRKRPPDRPARPAASPMPAPSTWLATCLRVGGGLEPGCECLLDWFVRVE